MSVLSWLLDLLYPPKCVLCRKLLTGKGPVCPHCMDKLPEFDGAAPSVRFTSGGAVSFFYEASRSCALNSAGRRFTRRPTAHGWPTRSATGLRGNSTCSHGRRSAGQGNANAAMTSRRFCAARSGRSSGSNPYRRSGRSRTRPRRRRPAARECLRRVPGRAAGALCGKARSDHRRYCNDWRNAGRVQPHAAAGGRVGRGLRGICRAEKTRLKDTTL